MAAQPVKYPSLLTGHILAYPGKQGFRMFTSVLKKKISCEYNKSVHTCVLQNQGNILASIKPFILPTVLVISLIN